MATDTSSVSEAEPAMRTVDFSQNPPVMQVTTLLRRMWQIDPDAIPNPGDDVEQLSQNVMLNIGKWMQEVSLEERWDDEVWKSRTTYALLDPPEGPETGTSDQDDAQGPLFTPFRRSIYVIYNHVFWDTYKALKGEVEEAGLTIGEFKPPNTSLMVLSNAKDELRDVEHLFLADCFVYPVWITSGILLSFTVDGMEKSVVVGADGEACTFALWFRAGTLAKIRVSPVSGADGEHPSRVLVLLALGQCEPRLPFPLEEHTIGPLGVGPSGQRFGADEGDRTAPEFWPEADHLARAIFLKAGDDAERCTFDEVHGRVEEWTENAQADANTDNDGSGSSPLYSPLPENRSIRLLVIEPASSGKDELQTRLMVVSLDDKPGFEALSYTWGDPSDKTHLRCGKAMVSIPRNLEDALKRLRPKSTPRCVWADSVCINQEDIQERGQQVSIMRDIYRAADNVLVWLGKDDGAQAKRAFTAACNIVRRWRPTGDRLAFSSYANLLEPLTEEGLAPFREVIDKEAWQSLRLLFESKYFSRFWIIQEIALGGSALVHWGEHCISWGVLGICASWMMTSGWAFRPDGSINAAYNAFLIYLLPLASRSGISPFSKLDLSVVLGATMGRFESTDARDRIFALLGMPFAGNDPEARHTLLNPDYSQDVRSVYTEAARRILEQDQHLRCLSAVQHGPELDPDPSSSYPSWVPRWDQSPHAEPLALRNEQGYYANGGELFCPSPSTFRANNTLTLLGLPCGTVTETSEELTKDNLSLETLRNASHRQAALTLFAHLNDEGNQYRASWSATLEKFTLFGCADPEYQASVFAGGKALSAVVSAQPGKYGMRASVEMLDGERARTDNLGEFLLYWRERVSWREEELRPRRGMMGAFWRAVEENGSPYMRERALCAVNTLARRRVFMFSGHDGEMVGLGPAAMREGDAVVVLFGGVVPFVLRPCEDAEGGKFWRLVGECFVPGLMQGEAVERAGLLVDGTFTRTDRGALSLTPPSREERDPRMERVAGEYGVCKFEIQ
ncbi:heterokaryon incompatibility protein-domain-containing protein [Immersiella caudata]|uniref:Heterokaryon incompatibility protein-domain-containing protein n=1 Tax=Immersiella caudata TaxID=314043 RepID=A0AA40BX60_9PEZI|nr:heterokaryon incompatibility protein-domain-containing protein [Immersiella caudata]